MSPSPFAAAMAAAEPKFDEHLGELVVLVPIKAGDFGRSIDTTREPLEVVALTNYVAPSAADVGQMDARFAHEETELEIRRANLPGRVFNFRKEDEVVLPDRGDEPIFKISRVDDVDSERIFVVLARLAHGST